MCSGYWQGALGDTMLKALGKIWAPLKDWERVMGLEPTTFCLGSLRAFALWQDCRLP